MKGTMFASFSQTVHKFVPTPSQAELILAFFVFNNFQVSIFWGQDFNTWQQIARTRIEYDYIEGERSFVCKISLKW